MPKYYGIKPKAATQAAVEAFENEVVVRQSNQRLLGTVYLDLDEAQWSLAVAYNVSRDRTIRSRENLLEVRYAYIPASDEHITVTCADPYAENQLGAGPFDDPDAFVRFALDHERRAANDAALR